MDKQNLEVLNAKTAEQRLAALKSLRKLVDEGAIVYDESLGHVNNHIHTTYSFSPYSPTAAVWHAKRAGLLTAGIVDHDAINGAREFIEAGKILDIQTTVGFECRVSMADTPFVKKRLNNTDQKGIAYVAMHGVPHTQFDKVEAFLKPYREKRSLRNEKMIQNINTIFGDGFLDYEKDVVFLSQYHDGGSITERHLMFGLAKALVKAYGKGQSLVTMLENKFSLIIKGGARERLLDENNDIYDYDLLSLLKGAFVGQIYVDATEECPHVTEFVAFAKEIGAIAAYAYLGDVKNSVTGDKLDMKFEDDYLDDFFEYLDEVGFTAVTYMPSRNTPEQLKRVRELCDNHGFFQISGEDINSPRQAFTCDALMNPAYANLITATWAMIGHELAATKDLTQGMFAPAIVDKYSAIDDRIEQFKHLATRS